jgi:hypothetical protein
MVPASAQVAVQMDLAALRRAEATASLLRPRSKPEEGRAALGMDPRQDLDRAVLAAEGRRGGLDFVVLLAGRFTESDIVSALRRREPALSEHGLRGQRLYSAPQGERVTVLFPRRGLLVIVSDGWLEPLLDRLEDRGPRLESNRELSRAIRRVGNGHAAWAASLLSPESGRLVAERTGWSELAQLSAVRASVDAETSLQLEGAASFSEESAAQALERRLRGLGREAGGLRVERSEREVRGRMTLGPSAVQQLWRSLGGSLGGAESGAQP